jgi:hypothetical protein
MLLKLKLRFGALLITGGLIAVLGEVLSGNEKGSKGREVS